MNLIQQAERLKTLPDQELLAMQQRPTVIAPYLVVAEMQRRQTMRKAATAGQDPVQQTTVAQEMSSRLAGMQPPQQQMQQQMPPAQQMRTGGVVRAQTGLAVGPDLAEVAPNPLTNFAAQMVAGQSVPGAPVPTIGNPFGMALDPGSLSGYGSPTDTAAELAKLRQVRGENPLAKIAEELGLEEQRVRGKKQGIGEILMRLGLGMAASRRPDFLGAIGEGGIGALQGFMQNRQLTQQQADELQRRRLALLERVQGSEDVLTREAADLARAQNATRNMEIQTIEANRRALANQAAQMRMAVEAAEANERLQMKLSAATTEREQQKAINQFNNEMKKLEYNRGTQLAVAAVQAQGRGGGGGGLGAEADKQIGRIDLAINRNNAAIESLYKRLITAPADQQEGIKNRIAELEARGDQMTQGMMIKMEELGLVPGIQATRAPKTPISAPQPTPPAGTPKPAQVNPKRVISQQELGFLRSLSPTMEDLPTMERKAAAKSMSDLDRMRESLKGMTPEQIRALSVINPSALRGILGN